MKTCRRCGAGVTTSHRLLSMPVIDQNCMSGDGSDLSRFRRTLRKNGRSTSVQQECTGRHIHSKTDHSEPPHCRGAKLTDFHTIELTDTLSI